MNKVLCFIDSLGAGGAQRQLVGQALVDSSISTESIIKTFEDAFKKWIPNSSPVVKEKTFFND